MIIEACFLLFVMGYLVAKFMRKWVETEVKQTEFKTDLPKGKLPQNQSTSQRYPIRFFDSSAVKIGPNVNGALEAIFNNITDRYVSIWYRKVSENADFIVQTRLFLQYLSGLLISRVKQVDVTNLIVKDAIPRIFNHFQHISAFVPTDAVVNSTNEDSVLRALGPHLHVCMVSRSAELAYLRCLTNRLLPLLSLPPGLWSPTTQSSGGGSNFTQFPVLNQYPVNSRNALTRSHSASPRGFYSTYPIGQKKPIPFSANRAAYSFLTEVLSAFILLPAMDALATPDFLNRLILILLTTVDLPDGPVLPVPMATECTTSDDGPGTSSGAATGSSDELVPVLKSYVDAWRHWLTGKTLHGLRLDRLLKRKEELCPFVQYMKSVGASTPLTAIILMDEVTRRVGVAGVPLSQDDRREVFSQLRHILSLGRGEESPLSLDMSSSCSLAAEEVKTESEDDGTPVGGVGSLQGKIIALPTRPSHIFHVLNLPDDFFHALEHCIDRPGAWSSPELVRFIRSPVWNRAFEAAYKAIEARFIPMYVESPEYLSHVLGLNDRSAITRPTNKISTKSPKRQPNPVLNSISHSLKNMLPDFTIDGPSDAVGGRGSAPSRPLLTRPPRSGSLLSSADNQVQMQQQQQYRNLLGEAAVSVEPTVIGQAVSHLGSGAPATANIDLSNWRVYIPGLSRPVVPTGRRLIDQILSYGGNVGDAPNPSGTGVAGYAANGRNLETVPLGVGKSPVFGRDTSPVGGSGGRRLDVAYHSKMAAQVTQMRRQEQPQSIVAQTRGDPHPQGGYSQPVRLSRQYLLTVRSETCVDGLRKPVSRVDRKYSEFYVLEQKLLEFHGQAITRQLPRRQLIPKTFSFLEEKRAVLEEYLQYLVRQPFLRNSELLYTFLTSKLPFSSNIFFDLTLGRLVKAVPIKLTRERGKSLDYFLISFYVSCKPQPTVLEPDDDAGKTAGGHQRSDSVVSILPSSGVASLSGCDVLAISDFYALPQQKPAQTMEGHRRQQQQVKPKGVEHAASDWDFHASRPTSLHTLPNKNATLGTGRHSRPNLDYRLRSRMFWNNSGLSAKQRELMDIDQPCSLHSLHPTGLCEVVLYFLDKTSEQSRSLNGEATWPPLPIFNVVSDPLSSMNDLQGDDQIESIPPPIGDTDAQPRVDVSHASWCEALFDGPVSLPSPTSLLCPNTDLDWLYQGPEKVAPDVSAFEVLPRCRTSGLSPQPEPPDPAEIPHVISIGLADLKRAMCSLAQLLKAHLCKRLRHSMLSLVFIVWRFFRLPFDRWLTSHLRRHLFTNYLTDSHMAEMLQVLNETLFYPNNPTTDTERMQNRENALRLIQETVSTSWISSVLADKDVACQRVSHLFSFLQQAKWNKQLSYVLLDQLVVQLFPELQTPGTEIAGGEGSSPPRGMTTG